MTDSPSVYDTDVVVIGSGHNGLTCAAYLAKAGLEVRVLEGEDSIGGGTSTRELIRKGFHHNTCGNFFHGFENYPIMRDLDLEARGFDYIIPEVQQAYVFGDDRALVIHRDTAASRQSIGRFSSPDADSWAGLSHRFTRALPLLVATEFTAPPSAGQLSQQALDRGVIDKDLSEELASLGGMTPYDAVDSYFESEQMRVLMKKLIHVVQATNKPGVGALLPAFFLNLTRNGLAGGGTQRLPEVLSEIVRDYGGEVLTNRRVANILIADDRAVGVRLDDGTEITARTVVSGVDFTQLVEMTGSDHFAPAVREKAQNWDWTSGGSLATIHLALNEPPRYRGEDFDPDVALAYNVSFGVDDSAGLEQSMADVTGERFPAMPVGNGSCNTIHDPSYVDGDGHVAFWWPFAPYVVDGDPANWDTRRDEYESRMLSVWRAVTSNLDGDNLLGTHLRTPLDVSRGNAAMRNGAVRMGPYTQVQSRVNRPHPDLADYRIPGIAGLYHASATSPNGGGLSGAAGYCAAGAIVEDLGRDRWWPVMTVEYAAELAVV